MIDIISMEQVKDEYVVTTRPIIPPYSEHPTLVTANPHVVLRPFHSDDLVALHTLRSQIEVMKWTSTGKIDADLDKTRSWMSLFMEVEKELDQTDHSVMASAVEDASNSSVRFNFAIVYRERLLGDEGEPISNETVIGAGGCHVLEPEPECGYMIRKEYWGRGIATAVLKAFLDAYWKLERTVVKLPLDSTNDKQTRKTSNNESEVRNEQNVLTIRETLKAEIDATNIGSQRVLEKCGFRYHSSETIEENGTGLTLARYTLERP